MPRDSRLSPAKHEVLVRVEFCPGRPARKAKFGHSAQPEGHCTDHPCWGAETPNAHAPREVIRQGVGFFLADGALEDGAGGFAGVLDGFAHDVRLPGGDDEEGFGEVGEVDVDLVFAIVDGDVAGVAGLEDGGGSVAGVRVVVGAGRGLGDEGGFGGGGGFFEDHFGGVEWGGRWEMFGEAWEL